jgi:hypothetical protein
VPTRHPALRPSIELFEARPILARLPVGVESLPSQIQGTSFFPGGVGIYQDDGMPECFPVGGVMVLAHDWGTRADFDAFSREGRENTNNPTWRQMLPFLRQVGIPLSDCFFTNFFAGLRAPGLAGTGVFPGAGDDEYVRQCRDFVLKQIATQKPRLILVLGIHVPALLAPASPDLVGWTRAKDFRKLDSSNAAVLAQVRFDSVAHVCSIACLVHPSYRSLNARHRRWRSLRGHEAEVEMVRWSIQQHTPH